MKERAYPITPRNSTVLGYSARSPRWRLWWKRRADWKNAFPCVGGVAALNVPVRDLDGAVYRVRPALARVQHTISSVRVKRIRGHWHWVYP